MWYGLLSLCVFPLAGCLHSAPAGATRGLVEIKNTHIWENPVQEKNTGILTGVAIGPNTVLTAAHTFMYEPAPGHPLLINKEIVDYSVIADGWAGKRDGREIGDNQIDDELVLRDYLFLRTEQVFAEHAVFKPISRERIWEFENATIVTRRIDDGQPVAIPLKKIRVSKNMDLMFAKMPSKVAEHHYLSGSPLIGTDQEGKLVLVGIASGYGTVHLDHSGGQKESKDQIFFIPAYYIPFDELADP